MRRIDPGPPLPAVASWRDPVVLVRGLQPGPKDEILLFDPTGDEAAALLAAGAGSVVCLVPDAPSRALVELKQRGAEALPLASFRALLGLDAFGRRVWFYHYLRDQLSPATRSAWDAREEQLRMGLLSQGRLERSLGSFRERLLPLLHRPATVEAFFSSADLETQRRQVEASWSGRRWRGLLSLLARDLRREAGIPITGGQLFERLLQVMQTAPASENALLQGLLLGRFLDLDQAPPPIDPGGHKALKEAGDRLVIADQHAFLADALAGRFHGLGLGAALAGASPQAQARLLGSLRPLLRPGARVLGWGPTPVGLAQDAALTTTLAATDRTVLWGPVFVGRLG